MSTDADAWESVREALDHEKPGTFTWFASSIENSVLWPYIMHEVRRLRRRSSGTGSPH